MSKAIDDLLKPRYKVISDYPGNVVPVGTVLEKREIVDEKCWKYDKDKYPHLFKKLEWWEERQESEMPEYVKWGERSAEISEDGTVSKDVIKVVKWRFYVSGQNVFMHWGDTFAESINAYYLQPATSAEYLNYQKQKS